MYDAIFIPGGEKSIETQKMQGDALHFVQEAFKHGKAIGASGAGVDLLEMARLPGVELATRKGVTTSMGVVTTRGSASGAAEAFIGAVSKHRHFNRDTKGQVPA